MPLFRATIEPSSGKRGVRKIRRRERREEDGHPSSLTQLCLWNLAENMKEVWVKDYADNYMDRYFFRHIMGPFNLLSGELVEELLAVLSLRRELSRAALHLLLVPQLRALSLGDCPALVTPSLCTLVGARCQGLQSMDLSGARQMTAQVQCDLLGVLPCLRSLSLAGTPCDRRVLEVVARRCPALRHLDVSRCNLLPPAGLLCLGGSSRHPPPLLCSLLALDVGIGQGDGEGAATAAFLLLTLPRLERAAMEGLGEALGLLHRGDFAGTKELTTREVLPSLWKVWTEGRREERAADTGRRSGAEEGAPEGNTSFSSDGAGSENEAEGPAGSGRGGEGKEGSRGEGLTLRLREVRGVSARTLASVSQLCPKLQSISLHCEEEPSQGSCLAAGLSRWAGQLRKLAVHFPLPLDELLPALQATGSCLVSLTLEGVRTSPHTPMLELLRACPRLRSFVVHAEPPFSHQEQEEEEVEEDNPRNIPCLPQLVSLSLNFSFDQRQVKTAVSWRSLRAAVWCLMSGSPLLETVSLVAVPCPLEPVFQRLLSHPTSAWRGIPCPTPPLQKLVHLNLVRSDVSMETASGLMTACRYLSNLDLSGCWAVSLENWTQLQRTATRRRQCITITWT